MPSITIRFEWATTPTPKLASQELSSMASRLQRDVIDHFTKGGESTIPWQTTFIDELTLDAIIDDGHGITAADRADAELAAELDGKAAARAAEYDEHHDEHI